MSRHESGQEIDHYRVVELLADLERLDHLDPGTFDLTPETPLGGLVAVVAGMQMWKCSAVIPDTCVGLIAAIVLLSVLLR